MARSAGAIAARLIPVRRHEVREHLALAFPEATDAERRALLPDVYAHLVAYALEFCALIRDPSPAAVMRLVETPLSDDGWLERLWHAGRGYVAVTGHLGNWDWGGAFLAATGQALAVVVKRQHNPWTDRLIQATRQRLGMKLISTGDHPRRLVSHVRQGGAVAIVADQDAGRDGRFVPFFGREASTAAGAAWLAVRLGVPLLPVWTYRTETGKVRITADPPIEADPGADPEAEIDRLTRYHVACLEAAIRRAPAQYFWVHRRWKTRPKEIKRARRKNKSNRRDAEDAERKPGEKVTGDEPLLS